MSDSCNTKLFLTGASGLLGRSIFKTFTDAGWNVYGTAFTRAKNNLHKLDITQKEEVRKAIIDFQPNFVLHAAAQRFPDKVDKDPEGAQVLNVESTQYIVDAADEVGAPVLYISTDYVFDGKSKSAYKVDDVPNPVNLYGKTKLEGEVVTLKNARNIVLRIPVLYGPVLNLKESAVTCLLLALLTPDKPSKVSNVERRCPSNVNDIAQICYQLLNSSQDNEIRGVYQWCGTEKMTKYQMSVKMGEALNLSSEHISADDTPPQANTTRPLDTELDCSRLQALGFGKHTPFCVGVQRDLTMWLLP